MEILAAPVGVDAGALLWDEFGRGLGQGFDGDWGVVVMIVGVGRGVDGLGGVGSWSVGSWGIGGHGDWEFGVVGWGVHC